MKKNIVGHMTSPRENKKSLLRRLDLLPRFFCLLLALLIWLAVVNVYDDAKEENTHATSETVESAE